MNNKIKRIVASIMSIFIILSMILSIVLMGLR
jgi:hypothetical protein